MEENIPHVWFFQRSTLLNVIDEGPYTDQQMLNLAKEGKLSLATTIRSPTRTKNNWITAESVPAIAAAISQRRVDAEADKAKSRESKLGPKNENTINYQQQPKNSKGVSFAVALAVGTIGALLGIIGGGITGLLAGRSTNKTETERVQRTMEVRTALAEAETRTLHHRVSELTASVEMLAHKLAESKQSQPVSDQSVAEVEQESFDLSEKEPEQTFDDAVRDARAIADAALKELMAQELARLTDEERNKCNWRLAALAEMDTDQVFVSAGIAGYLAQDGMPKTASAYIAAVALKNKNFLSVARFGWEKVSNFRTPLAIVDGAARCLSLRGGQYEEIFGDAAKYQGGPIESKYVRDILETIIGVTADELQ